MNSNLFKTAQLAAKSAGVKSATVAPRSKEASLNKEATLSMCQDAKIAAVELYRDCLSKMAYAEDLFAEAEKVASDNGSGSDVETTDQVINAANLAMPMAGGVGGAMAGAAGGFGYARMAGGASALPIALGAGVGATAGALAAFIRQKQLVRAQGLSAMLNNGVGSQEA